MIDFMLDYLCRETIVFIMLWLEVLIQIINLNLFVPGAGPYAIQRKTALLCLIFSGLLGNNRIDHWENEWPHSHDNDLLLHTNHVRSHTHA